MITTNRNEFLGVHVTGGIKILLREVSEKRGVSVSRLVYEILLRDLKRKFKKVEEER